MGDMEVQRDGSLEKGSVDLVVHPTPVHHNASIEIPHNGSNIMNHNTITYVDNSNNDE